MTHKRGSVGREEKEAWVTFLAESITPLRDKVPTKDRTIKNTMYKLIQMGSTGNTAPVLYPDMLKKIAAEANLSPGEKLYEELLDKGSAFALSVEKWELAHNELEELQKERGGSAAEVAEPTQSGANGTAPSPKLNSAANITADHNGKLPAKLSDYIMQIARERYLPKPTSGLTKVITKEEWDQLSKDAQKNYEHKADISANKLSEGLFKASSGYLGDKFRAYRKVAPSDFPTEEVNAVLDKLSFSNDEKNTAALVHIQETTGKKPPETFSNYILELAMDRYLPKATSGLDRAMREPPAGTEGSYEEGRTAIIGLGGKPVVGKLSERLYSSPNAIAISLTSARKKEGSTMPDTLKSLLNRLDTTDDEKAIAAAIYYNEHKTRRQKAANIS